MINQIFIELSKEGRVEDIKFLISEFKDEIKINVQDEVGNTPLHYGAYRGNLELVELLVNFGGRLDVPNSIGLTPEGILKFKKGA